MIKLIDYEQCKKCGWNLSFGCSQQERRPIKGDKCPTKTLGGKKEFIMEFKKNNV